MEQVVKVSIANIPFTLEYGAHVKLEQYLRSLEDYYSNNPNGEEIVSGIEERISELLSERGFKNGIVPLSVVEEIIAILGSVDELEGNVPFKERPSVKKRLYRDTDNKIISGVCSGLGAYFDIDPILFRLFFSLGLIITLFVGSEWFMVWGIVYSLLWIVIPQAATSSQKCQMRGEDDSIGAIEHGVESGTRRDYGSESLQRRKLFSSVGRIFCIILGLMFLLIGLVGVLLTLFGFSWLAIFDSLLPFSVSDFISMITSYSKWIAVLFMILVGLVVSIPFLSLVYWGVLMLFNLKSPKWRPGLIMFILWIVSFIGFSTISFCFATEIPDHNHSVSESIVISPKDTIYVEYVDYQKYKDYRILVDGDRSQYNLYYVDEDKNSGSMVCYPHLEINKSGRFTQEPRLLTHSLILGNRISMVDIEQISEGMFFSYENNTLYLSPKIVTRGETMTDIFRYVSLRVAPDVTVIVKGPIPHQFNDSFEFTDIKFKKVVGLFY